MSFGDMATTRGKHGASALALGTRGALLIFSVVFLAAMAGIATRPAGLLASVWPANALLLGLFVRNPRMATPTGWAAAVAGYFAADLLTGAALEKTILLTAGNLVGVLVGFILYRRLPEHDRRLRRPFSVLFLALIAAVGSALSGVFGAIIHPILFHGGAIEGLLYWFVTEFLNYVIILPVVLSFPTLRTPLSDLRLGLREAASFAKAGPLAALILSCAASWWIGGPGAAAFAVPALLWCALSYSVCVVALVTLAWSAWTLVAIASGIIDVGVDVTSMPAILSIRIGVALMALAPINVASAMAARSEFPLLLQRMVTNDPLTAALTRRAFTVRCRNLLRSFSGERQQSVALLVFDVDDMKRINATRGLAAGDEVLQTLARSARAALPHAEDLGRVGGDAFSVLLTGYRSKEATDLAARISKAFRINLETLDDPQTRETTVSFGIAFADNAPRAVDPLLADAERALARARADGGNRFALADEV